MLSEKSSAATKQVERLQLIFPEDLFLQIQKLGGNRDVELLEKTTEIASLAELPLLAANNPRFLNQDDYLSLDARVCIDRGDIIDNTNRVRDYTPEQYFKTEKEMADLFSDIPGAVQNTVNLAKKCNFQFITDQAVLPAYTVPKGQTIKDFLNKEGEDYVKKGIVLDRLTEPKDISPVISLIVSGKLDHATGSTIDINGGSYLR